MKLPSLASQLPQGSQVNTHFMNTFETCGSGLARDEASQANARALAKRLARAPAANCITP